MTTLEGLASQVNSHASALSKLLAEAKLAQPSFAPDAAPSPPHGKEYEKVQAARMALVEAAQSIRDLALGPDDCITAFSDGVSLDFLFGLHVMTNNMPRLNTILQLCT